jgi:hypothetical protein|tara:strand:+ start:400 stop:531 length:132 start_codon:yes stop_codon:yes gene_type:complete
MVAPNQIDEKLSEETQKDIAEARKEYSKGNVSTLEEVEKKAGL